MALTASIARIAPMTQLALVAHMPQEELGQLVFNVQTNCPRTLGFSDSRFLGLAIPIPLELYIQSKESLNHKRHRLVELRGPWRPIDPVKPMVLLPS